VKTQNPIRRLGCWLGWSEDQYLTGLGYVPLVAAFVAGVVLSYTSLVDLAAALGFGPVERPFFPFAIDALVVGCYIAQARLAGLAGFGWHRVYVVVLGVIAAALTASGNAIHGLIVWQVVKEPLPWPVLVAGSLVPALAMVGVSHALAICRSASRARAAADIELESEDQQSNSGVTDPPVIESDTSEDTESVIKQLPVSSSSRSSKGTTASRRAANRTVRKALADGREPTVTDVAKATHRSHRQARRLLREALAAVRPQDSGEVVIQLQGGGKR
jgi:hypothetical protein